MWFARYLLDVYPSDPSDLSERSFNGLFRFKRVLGIQYSSTELKRHVRLCCILPAWQPMIDEPLGSPVKFNRENYKVFSDVRKG